MCEGDANPSSIGRRVLAEFFSARILGNTERGIYCEAMIAEQLGPDARITSHGWHPWDIQIGNDAAAWPERIRIQVRNSARLQTWHSAGQSSACEFRLTYRHLPESFHRDHNDTPCEEIGFLCDVFLLCHHPAIDHLTANHTDPAQWVVHVLSARPDGGHITPDEIGYLHARAKQHGKSSLIRKPETLGRGIRGRRPAPAIPLTRLSIGMLRHPP